MIYTKSLSWQILAKISKIKKSKIIKKSYIFFKFFEIVKKVQEKIPNLYKK